MRTSADSPDGRAVRAASLPTTSPTTATRITSAGPLDGLASPGFAAHRAGRHPRDMQRRTADRAGDPWAFHDGGPAGRPAARPAAASPSTTQVAVVDAEARSDPLITTIGHDFGSLVYVPEVGVFLNSSMVNFDPRPDRPNSIAPGKMPFFAVRDRREGDRAFFAAGGSGGYRILSGVVHAFVPRSISIWMSATRSTPRAPTARAMSSSWTR